MVKLLKRVKNGAFLYQNNACYQGTACVITQRAWRHYEHFQKLRDEWAIPAVTGLIRLLGPVSTIFALYNIPL